MAEKQTKTSAKVLKNMSTEEFQNKLYVWFEENGVLSELRTHLRHQMIAALKATELGRKVSKEQKLNLNLSPKYQALNLIIAEYLLQQGYHYALSVFSSEVPMLSSLPKFIHQEISNESGDTTGEESKHVKFKERDVWDILEALGLPVGSKESQIIFSAYQSDLLHDTLLVCLIRMLPAALRDKDMQNKTSEPPTIPAQNSQSGTSYRQYVDKSTAIEINGNGLAPLIGASNEGKRPPNIRKNFRERKRKEIELNQSTSDGCKSTPEESEVDLKFKESSTVLSSAEIENVLAELHERMQKAFDHELEIAHREEWQKCRNVIENKEREIEKELELERIKIRRTESRTREKMQKELELEKVRLAEQQKVRQLEMERNIARELELERYKLLNEYKQIIQSKDGDLSELVSHQQNNLGIALDRVLEQSNRLRDKEDLLNKRLSELEVNFKNKYSENITKETSDVASQSCLVDEQDLLIDERKAINMLRMELETIKKQFETAVDLKANISTTDKAVQTPYSKNIQTSFDNAESVTASENSVNHDDFEKLLESRKKLKGGANSEVKSKSKETNNESVSCNKSQQMARKDDKAESQNQTNNNVQQMDGSENSLGYVLKTLHHENTYLKAFTAQQRQQISELISKQMCMGKEVSEANAQVQELSTQLTEMGRVMKSAQPDVSREKSTPSSHHKKDTGRESRNDSHERRSYQTVKSSSTNTDNNRNCFRDRTQLLVASSDESANEEIANRNRSLSKSRDTLRRPRTRSRRAKVKEEKETSPTDDVLKEARKRLKMLELESDAVDRSYQEFKRRHSANLIDSISLPSRNEDFYQKTKDASPDAFSKSVYFSDSNFIPKNKSSAAKDAIKGVSNSRTRFDLRTALTPDVTKQIPYDDRQNTSLPFNIQRRVHEPTMNIDKNDLQNYIATVNKMKKFSSKSPNTFAKLLVHDRLHRNVKSMPDVSTGTKYTGTTAFLLERIANCTTNVKKFNPKISETKIMNSLSENNILDLRKSVKSLSGTADDIQGGGDDRSTIQNNRNPNSTINDYEKYIGQSREQYKIKPLLHWKNVKSSPKDIEKVVSSSRDGECVVSSNTTINIQRKEFQDIRPEIATSVTNNGKDYTTVKENKTELNNSVLNENKMPFKVPDRDSVRRRLFTSEISNSMSIKSNNNIILSVSNANEGDNRTKTEIPDKPKCDEIDEKTKNVTTNLNAEILDSIESLSIGDGETKQPEVSQSSSRQRNIDEKQFKDDNETNTEKDVTVETPSIKDVNDCKKSLINSELNEKDDDKLPLNAKDVSIQETNAESILIKSLNVKDSNPILENILVDLTDNITTAANIHTIRAEEQELEEGITSSVLSDRGIPSLGIIEANDMIDDSMKKDNIPGHKIDNVLHSNVESLVEIINIANQNSPITAHETVIEKSENEVNVDQRDSESGTYIEKLDGSISNSVSKENQNSLQAGRLNGTHVADIEIVENADAANETALSEELAVPSSIEMSSDQSPVSVPPASDDNESFWN